MYNILKNKIVATTVGIAVALPLAGLITAPGASAHASVQAYGGSYTAGSYGQMFIRIPHSCSAESPTTKIEVNLPAEFTAIKPQQKAAWNTFAKVNTEGTTTVTWDNGSLPNNLFDDFGISVKFPSTAGKYYIPVVQTCADGDSVAWIEQPAEGVDSHSLKYPAPSIMVQPKPVPTMVNLADVSVVSKKNGTYLTIDAPLTMLEDKVTVSWNGKKLLTTTLDAKGDATVKLSQKVINNYAKGGVLKVSANKQVLFEETIPMAGHNMTDGNHSNHGSAHGSGH